VRVDGEGLREPLEDDDGAARELRAGAR